MQEVLLLIPPLTQLNTPYPATAYLKGFFNQQGIPSRQGDLGLDMVLQLFSQQGLTNLFNEIEKGKFKLSPAFQQIIDNRTAYENTINAVITFLQHKNYTTAYRIAQRNFLPEGSRFNQIEELEWFFGNNGIQDKARYLCTLYLEDISDIIVATVGPHFGFSKYAERVARTAVSFTPIQEALTAKENYLDTILLQCLQKYFEVNVPALVCFTVPFPGNLYGALKAGQWIKKHYPETIIAMGGGYANTELRDLYEPAVFDYVDFISLDDGEAPLLALYRHIIQPEKYTTLKRTFTRVVENDTAKVVFINNDLKHDFSQKQLPAPSYEGLRTKEYLSVIDMPNPMHRLWSDGRWNKLTIAHGCYWKKCSFCDISLNYISHFEQSPAKQLVDKMEQLIAETGERGFHFVDEAAPPLAMRDLALEILRRNLQVTWWTNIRFEKTFTEDLCKLLAASGCIAVTGGLEVASDRLLQMMEKGVTIEQVARVCKGFRDAGILVHAYLMYGFPTETEQETIDSLEIVRQLFQQGLLQSAFWHQFAMTVHSPVGIHPEKYQVIRTGPTFEGFANNDLYHEDPTGADHEKYSDGLKKALYNYMHEVGFDFPLHEFFDFRINRTTIHPHLISGYLKKAKKEAIALSGSMVLMHLINFKLQKQQGDSCTVQFTKLSQIFIINMPAVVYQFLQKNKEAFYLHNANINAEMMVNHLCNSLALSEEQLLKQDWFKQLRKEVFWFIKK